MSSAVWLDELKEHLNITGDTSDSELATTLDAAESAITARVGPLATDEATTARVSGNRTVLLLPSAPVSSLTSVTDANGTVLDVGDLLVDNSAGTIAYSDGSWFRCRAYDVVYTAGYDDVPADIVYAIKELARHLWRSQRGPASLPGQGGADTATPGFLIPNAVAELIEPYIVPHVG